MSIDRLGAVIRAGQAGSAGHGNFDLHFNEVFWRADKQSLDRLYLRNIPCDCDWDKAAASDTAVSRIERYPASARKIYFCPGMGRT